MDDIRIKIGFLDHPKTLKLQKHAGDGAVLSLIRLFAFTAQNKPRGVLEKMTGEDIELASRWTGEEGKLVDTLLAVGFLENHGEWFQLHDWRDHNPWAYGAPERSANASMAAKARWAKPDQDAERMPPACETHAQGNAPSPSPNPNTGFIPSPVQISKKTRYSCPDPDGPPFRLAHYFLALIQHRDPKAKANIDVWARDIDLLIRIDGRDPEEIERLMAWCQADPFEQNNVLSPAKLRKRYTALKGKMATGGKTYGQA